MSGENEGVQPKFCITCGKPQGSNPECGTCQPQAAPLTAPVVGAMKPCPLCGEQILAVAIKCKHCGSDLSNGASARVAPVASAPQRPVVPPQSANTISIWRVLGLTAATCIIPGFFSAMVSQFTPISPLAALSFAAFLFSVVAAAIVAVVVGRLGGEKPRDAPKKFADGFLRRAGTNGYLLLLVVLGTGSGFNDALPKYRAERRAQEAEEAGKQAHEAFDESTKRQAANAKKQAEEELKAQSEKEALQSEAEARQRTEQAERLANPTVGDVIAKEEASRPVPTVPSQVFLAQLKKELDAYPDGYGDELRPAQHAAMDRAEQFDTQYFARTKNKVIEWEGVFGAIRDEQVFYVPSKGSFYIKLLGRELPADSRIRKEIAKLGEGACASVSGTIKVSNRTFSPRSPEGAEYSFTFEQVLPCKSAQAIAPRVAEAEQSRLRALPSAENLASAHAAMSDGYEVKTNTGGRLDDAESALNAVAARAPEAAEARKMLVEIKERRDRQHLEAARTALSDNYDSKTGFGGELDVADEHLKAIAPGSKVRAEAKSLLADLAARLGRRDQREKIAAFMKERGGSDTFVFNNGHLVVNTEGDSGSVDDITVSGYAHLAGLAEEGFTEVPGLQDITVIEMGELEDTRGNKNPVKIGEFMVTKATARSINWQSPNVRTRNLLSIIDRSWMAPWVRHLLSPF